MVGLLADLKRVEAFKILGIASLGAFLLYFLISSPRGVILLVGICLLLIGLLFILKPYYFLLIYMAAAPFTYLLGTTEKMSPIRLIGPLLILCTLPAILLHTKSLKVRISPLGMSVILFIFACFLSIFSLVSPEDAIFGFLLFLGNGLFYGIVIASVDSMKKVKTIIWVMCGTFGLAALWGLNQRFLYGKEIYAYRVYGSVGNPNYFALLLSPIAIIILYQFWSVKKTLTKIFFLLFFLSLTLTILFTLSRGVIVAFSVALFWVFIRRKKWREFLAVVAIIIAILFLLPESMVSGFRWGELMGRFRMHSIELRGSFIHSGIKMFIRHPLIGIGAEGFSSAYLDYRDDTKVPAFYTRASPHNGYIRVLVDTGLVGFIPFLFIIFFSIKNYRNAKGKGGEGEKDLFIESLESGFVVHLLGLWSVDWCHSILLWFFIGLSSVLNRLKR